MSVLFGRRGTAPQNELVSLAGYSACNNIPNRENSGQWRPGSGPWCSDQHQCLEKSLASQLTELPCLAGHGFSRARPSTRCLSFYIPAFFLKSTLLLSFPTSNLPPGVNKVQPPLGHGNLQAQKHPFLALGIRQWDGFHTNVQWQKERPWGDTQLQCAICFLTSLSLVFII